MTSKEATRIAEAQRILEDFGFDRERTNERSAAVLLALLALKPDTKWAEAECPLLGTRAIMEWIREYYLKDYAPNTRETIRRFTLHQFSEALLVEQNPDQPDRPINSPKWCYQVHERALRVIRLFDTPGYQPAMKVYLADRPGLKSQYAAAREMQRIPVTLLNGAPVMLSPGGQNVLLKKVIENFCAYFTPGGQVLYVGDADTKWTVFERRAFEGLGVVIDEHGKMPDLVVLLPDKNWLVLVEAASSHGPVDSKRRGELGTLFSGSKAGLVYVSCFPSREEMRKYVVDIAWETEVWCADNPTHLIHFNGERFLGPYGYEPA